jgi:hypothetical protein
VLEGCIIIIIKLPNQAIASTPSAPRPTGAAERGSVGVLEGCSSHLTLLLRCALMHNIVHQVVPAVEQSCAKQRVCMLAAWMIVYAGWLLTGHTVMGLRDDVGQNLAAGCCLQGK